MMPLCSVGLLFVWRWEHSVLDAPTRTTLRRRHVQRRSWSSRKCRRVMCPSKCVHRSSSVHSRKPRVTSKTLGYLDAVLVDRGDKVKTGQLIALVRPSDLPDQLVAARGSLARHRQAAHLHKKSSSASQASPPRGVVSQQELQQRKPLSQHRKRKSRRQRRKLLAMRRALVKHKFTLATRRRCCIAATRSRCARRSAGAIHRSSLSRALMCCVCSSQ